jgi:hypothetical protein
MIRGAFSNARNSSLQKPMNPLVGARNHLMEWS